MYTVQTCTNERGELRNRTVASRLWKLVRSVSYASLIIHRKWLLHYQREIRYSCNHPKYKEIVPSRVILNIEKEHKHPVQTQIRLFHLTGVCTISYSVFLNKHKRKHTLMILNIGQKYLNIQCVSRSYCSIKSGSTEFFLLLFQTFSHFTGQQYLIQQLYGVQIFSVIMVFQNFTDIPPRKHNLYLAK